MTKKLSLLRHAKSSWDDPVARDFDRPLNARGEKAARLMGEWMRGENIAFDQIVASPAIRVVETLDVVADGYGKRFQPVWERRIYLASSATLIDVLKEIDDDYDHVLMVGHNPGMEDMVLDLVPDRPGPEKSANALRQAVYEKYPTAAYAQMELDITSWSDIARNSASLINFIRPRDLDPELGPEEF
ncbi:MAG: histidine phosphatase family protein [Sphingorhabdus sp.]